MRRAGAWISFWTTPFCRSFRACGSCMAAYGKGILRQALAEMFADHPHVEKFFPAPKNEGGAGATIVELKV